MPDFTPAPRNDFAEYIALYYGECRRRFPRIQAIAGKWTFEDLIPGLSDFDTRFIVEDGMTAQDWCDMSEAVGQTHLDLCRRYPHWDRNLEHLPGINLTWAELTSPAAYYPEYPQWTFHAAHAPVRLDAAKKYLADRPWSNADDYFHLKKFCLYYGRYNRTIDPAVNLGAYASKYPLHSRFMHYFCPPLQSALCLLLRRPVAGKMESVRLARKMFPKVAAFREMQEAVEAHYERPEWYEEPELSRLDDRLEAALDLLRKELASRVTLIADAGRKSIREWKTALDAAPVDPAMLIFDAAKFSRLMKGRLKFYGSAPEHFDTDWLIENELGRMRQNFLQTPVMVYWRLRTGERTTNVMEVIPRLAGDVLTSEDADFVVRFNRLFDAPRSSATRRRIALDLAEVFDGFFHALCKIVADARRRGQGEACGCASSSTTIR